MEVLAAKTPAQLAFEVAARTTIAGIGLALVQTEAIAVSAHGEAAHQANGQSRWLRLVNDHIMWTLTADRRSWSSAHVGDVAVRPVDWKTGSEEATPQVEGIMHHGMTDANIYPQYEIERYLQTIEEDQDRYRGFPTLPEASVPNLDLDAEFKPDEVRQLGKFGMAIVREVMGDDYQPPTGYTIEEANDIMDFSKPRYTYGPAKRHPKNVPYTQDEIARILLADPYSPALEHLDDRIRNGPFAIFRRNVTRFRAPADLFRRHPEYLRPMLRGKELDSLAPDNRFGPAVLYGGAILFFTGSKILKEGVSVKSVSSGAATGALAATGGVMGPIKGGQIVNGWGHAAKMQIQDFWNTLRNKPYRLKMNEDGSYMTTLEGNGKLQRAMLKLVGSIFFGELYGQPPHHQNPGNRNYSFFEGKKGVRDEPITGIIKYFAEKGWFGLRPGKGFGLKPGERRPDERNSAVTEIIQPARVRTRQINSQAA